MDRRRAQDSFPRRQARTRRFTLGVPRSFAAAPDGARVAFLRTAAGDDPGQRLWVLDVPSGEERCVADPAALGAAAHGDLPPEERARRERVREAATGIVAYATDRGVRSAAFALAGRLYVADLTGDAIRRLDVDGPVVDPRLSPDGRRVAFVCAQALHVTEVGASQRAARLVGEDDAAVSWGLAEFVAAEELGRTRGFWWSPSSDRLLVARVDSAEVQRWHLAEPAEPARPPGTLAYPAAGTANARVTLAVVALDGSRTPVDWDVAALPYLVDALWTPDGPLTVVVQSRDQRTVQVLTVDPATGATTVVRTDHDERWVDIVAGVPRWLGDGRLVHTVDRDDTRRLALDGDPITPPSLEVRQVVAVGEDSVVATASEADPTAVGVWRVPTGGGDPEPVSTDHGVHSAAGTPGLLVVQSRDLQTDGVRTVVHGADGPVAIASRAERPGLVPRVRLLSLGRRELRSALLLPRGYADADGPLPVLLDPYGGPHAQRVLRSRDAFLVSQWFADAGFAVLVTDGRGTPGRGPAWERAVWGDLASAPLTDQVDALHAVAERHPLDLHRVAIRGWSFGGYLAALAVLRRPDVFHAAIAGAPVTDWRLYDTHYTERYLGLPEPDDQSGPYARSSLLADAPRLERPLLLIHGLADDNVVAAHTLRLSRALLEAGRPHQVLPLSGVTHMTPQEAVAESLLLLQLDFLHRALGMPGDPTETEPGRPRGRPAAAAESSPARGRPERAGPEL